MVVLWTSGTTVSIAAVLICGEVEFNFIEGETQRSFAHSEVYAGNDQEEQKDSSSEEDVSPEQHNVSSRGIPQPYGRAGEKIHSLIRKRYRIHR